MLMSASADPAGSSSLDLINGIQGMTIDSCTPMHVPARCTPKLHPCLRVGGYTPAPFPPRVPWMCFQGAAGEEGYWLFWAAIC